jgi:hypothetical protein
MNFIRFIYFVERSIGKIIYIIYIIYLHIKHICIYAHLELKQTYAFAALAGMDSLLGLQ